MLLLPGEDLPYRRDVIFGGKHHECVSPLQDCAPVWDEISVSPCHEHDQRLLGKSEFYNGPAISGRVVGNNDVDRLHGTDQFEAAVKAYVDQYGLPDDWSTLSLLLDYSDPETVAGAIQAMKPLYEGRSLMEQQGFKAKLDILAMTTRNSDLRDAAEEILKAL